MIHEFTNILSFFKMFSRFSRQTYCDLIQIETKISKPLRSFLISHNHNLIMIILKSVYISSLFTNKGVFNNIFNHFKYFLNDKFNK